MTRNKPKQPPSVPQDATESSAGIGSLATVQAADVDVCCRRWLAKYPDADPVRHDGTKWSELS